MRKPARRAEAGGARAGRLGSPRRRGRASPAARALPRLGPQARGL